MAITSIGYDGTVDEVQWAKLAPLAAGSEYGVAGIGDWKVTAHPTLDRGVVVALGDGWGQGVYDTSSANVTLQGAVVSSGYRWDMVVAHRDWSGAAGATTFSIVMGTSTRDLPNRAQQPGVLDDQPLALVRFNAGQTAVQEIIDLRVWPGNGGMVAADLLARNYNTRMGSRFFCNGEDWVSTVSSTGSAVWQRTSGMNSVQLFGVGGLPLGQSGAPKSSDTQFLIQAGSTVGKTDANSNYKLNFPTPFPNGLLTVIVTNGDTYTFADMTVGVPGTDWGTSPANRSSAAVRFMGDQAQSDGGTKRIEAPNHNFRINWIAIGW